jgi:sulfur-oxidizing protein SoxX
MACHTFAGLEKTRLQAGNIAPPLVAMKTRFPDRAKLRAQVWDAAKNNSATVMPPFGRHKVLSEKEIDLVVDWLQTL